MHKRIVALTLVLSLGSLAGCQKYSVGTIKFVLNGGSFADDSFSTDTLQGQSNTPVKVTIPDPIKSGYYFVGWREKNSQGSYTTIKQYLYENEAYYYYPYGTATFYAYFEPLSTITFDLGTGKDSAGVLVDPKNTTTSYSNGVLSGYATMNISSTDYLPTATASHKTFNYWASEYPLVEQVDSENNKHFVLDTAQTAGAYRFDTAFGSESMCFPVTTDSTLKLTAQWVEDPTFTLHFNIDGKENVSFQAKNEVIKTQIEEKISSSLGVDFTGTGPYYYPSDTKAKRFAGYYLDSSFNQPFNISSEINTKSLDIYFKWNDKIQVVLDYNGGKVGDNTTDTFTDYYSEDILGSDFLTNHTPTKDKADFLGYKLAGKDFLFNSDKLPATDCTLIAQYDDYPVLTLKASYPTGYTGAKLEDEVSTIKKGQDLSSVLQTYLAKVTDNILDPVEFVDSNGAAFTYQYMTDDDLTLTLNIGYKLVLDIKTYSAASTALTGVEDTLLYCSDGDKITETELASLATDFTVSSVDYCFDGFYSDAALTKSALPLVGTTSFTSQVTKIVYRKMTKAVKMTFVDSSLNPLVTGGVTMNVIPNGRIDYDKVKAKLNGDYTLYLVDSTSTPTKFTLLDNYWPSTDSEIKAVLKS
ncbi:MAG: hypothetical protein WCR56_01320 [Bacilli bacterium]|jgi:hypothetical protein